MATRRPPLDEHVELSRAGARRAVDGLTAVAGRLSALVDRLDSGGCRGIMAELIAINPRLEGVAGFLELAHPAEPGRAPDVRTSS
jgi:hypothetical protein